MNSKRDINEYLFYEFGFDLEESEDRIDECYPYELIYLGEFKINENEIKVFEFFDEGESNIVLSGNGLSIYKRECMELEDIYLQVLGSKWIGEKDAIGLETTKIGYDNIPSVKVRKIEIERLACNSLNTKENIVILEGLFLAKTQKYIALVQQEKEKFIIGTEITEKMDKFNSLSAWRLLSWGIGRLVDMEIIK